jgi:hypothetical protein
MNVLIDDWNFEWNTTWLVRVIATMAFYNLQKNSQGVTNNVGLPFSVGDTIPQFTSSVSKTIRIGDTKYHIECSY